MFQVQMVTTCYILKKYGHEIVFLQPSYMKLYLFDNSLKSYDIG